MSLDIPCYRYILHVNSPHPKVIKLFSCSAQLTIVGIFTFINRINYCHMEFMPEFSIDISYFSIYIRN